MKSTESESPATIFKTSGTNGFALSPYADFPQEKEGKTGMNTYVTMFFLVALMTGAGFLALPQAIGKAGFMGLPLLLIFGASVAFSGTRLGQCWVILEERWLEYREPARQPYMEIAFRAYGKPGRILTMTAAMITMSGSCIVFIILIAQFLEALVPSLTFCTFVMIVGVILVPLTWFGTPNDFWQASVFAVLATSIACVATFVQLLLENDTLPDPSHESPTFISFSFSFSTILFAFGGASVFPTIQNDMADRSQFWKSVVMGYTVLIILYFPVSAAGYFILGSKAPDNILLFENTMSLPIKIASIFEVINLLVTYLIACNPVCQTLEEVLNMSRDFGWSRCILRTSIVLLEVLVALSFPDFGLILNLIGGSSVTLCSFIFPPLFYMKLVKDSSKNKSWRQRSIPMWEKALLWEILGVGVIGAISSTGSAVVGIINSPMGASCFVSFSDNSTATG